MKALVAFVRCGRWRSSATLTVLAIGLSACSTSSTHPAAEVAPSATSSGSIDALLATMTRQALARQSVHLSIRAQHGTQTAIYDDDAGVDDGRQIIRIGAIRAQVIEIRDRAYIMGNDAAVVNFFGFRTQLRDRLANRWLMLTPADNNYAVVTEGVTLGSAIQDLIPASPLSRGTAVIDGQPCIAITGSAPVSSGAPAGSKVTLYLSNNAESLPVRETGTAPGDLTQAIDLTNWGETLTLRTPAHAASEAALVSGRSI